MPNIHPKPKKRPPDPTYGRALLHLRLQAKLSQSALAALLGLSPAYVSHLERGTRTPSLNTLSGYAHALGTSLEAIAKLVKRLNK